MSNDLEERLKSHARAFDSLLSLIPAKVYYGEDVSDQWKRKKQTPEQRRAAKMAKLDPDNWKSAKDVMDEREADLKRKREQEAEGEEEGGSPVGGLDVATERPKADQDIEHRQTKKRKANHNDDNKNEPLPPPPKTDNVSSDVVAAAEETDDERRRRKADKKAARRERQRQQNAKLKEKKERQKERKRAAKRAGNPPQHKAPAAARPDTAVDNGDDGVDEDEAEDKDVATAEEEVMRGKTDVPTTASALQTNLSLPIDDEEMSDSSESDAEDLPIFSPQYGSAGSSISSIQTAPPEIPQSTTSKPASSTQQPQPSNVSDTTQTPRERLQAAISSFRAERKADGSETRPAKNRHELLEQRRKKEAERKAAKKEQKRREKEEATRRDDEEIARRFSPGGSGSLLASPRSPQVDHNNGGSGLSGNNNNSFTYGQISFSDGTQLHHNPNSQQAEVSVLSKKPRHGASSNDTLAALKAAETKKSRLSGLASAEKRAELEQKDMWLNAKKRAHGERVRDDSSLLKKTLKRQQSAKKKSEREWTERKEGVQKAQAARQHRRNENLQKRRDDKAGGGGGKSKGGGGGVKPRSKGKPNVKKRPGFEGSFRARTSSAGKGGKK